MQGIFVPANINTDKKTIEICATCQHASFFGRRILHDFCAWS